MDVADYLGVLRRRWLPIVVCVVAGIAGALALTRGATETYQSSARLFVNIPEARGVQESLQGVQLTSNLLRSYAEVATSRSAAQQIIDDLELEMSAATLSRKLKAVPTADTLLITISATDEVPAQAERLANGAADVFIDIVAELEAEREEKIEARVIDAATEPTTPTSPRPRRNLVAGIGLGAVLGLALAFLFEALDRTIKTPDQAQTAVGRPLLAVVPRRREKRELVTAIEADVAGEAYRALRTSLHFLAVDTPVRSVVVTSPSTGEGKTTTAANLAVAYAQSGARVVYVDADLRRGRGSEVFGVADEPGLSAVLTGRSTLAQALVAAEPNLQVLPAGSAPPNPAELVGSQAMAQVLAELDERVADVVIVDAPPIVPVTDAVALATQVEAVVLVVRAGRTHRDMAEEATRRMEVVGANVVGCVLNAVPRSGQMRYQQDYRYGAGRGRG